jgi:hypothetical protein
MKYLQTINEYQRTVGFRYSEPKEKYKVSLLCKGQDINEDKINEGLSKVSELTYDSKSIEVNLLDEGMIAELPEIGSVEISAIVSFNVTLYNEKEVNGVVSELGQKLSKFDIEILDFKSKENLED